MNFIEIANAASETQEPSALGFLLPIFILVLMYFILIRPQSKKLKEHKQMLTELKVGDEISTAGGLLGKIIKVRHKFTLGGVQEEVYRRLND